MPRLSLWDKRKRNDYKFFDRVIAEQYTVGGTSMYLHKYLGPTEDQLSEDQGNINESSIQDVLFLENRDRRYDPDVYELRCVYTVNDIDFDLRQFGLFLSNDTLFITVHLNNMLESVGRKIMSGDVIELPHLRDDALLDEDKVVNKYYAVTDSVRPAEGFSQTWYPHLWRIKAEPITDSQEFSDILNREVLEDGSLGDIVTDGGSLKDLISTFKDEIGISDAIMKQAEELVPKRNFETAHLYVVPGKELGHQYPWIFAGDGKPPNGAELAGSGDIFPQNPEENAYFLRTDYEPNILFRYNNNVWVRIEVDYRKNWSAANRILQSFIVNDKENIIGRNEAPVKEKQGLSEVVRPRDQDKDL